MRAHRAPSEILRLARPLATGLDAAWQRMHWWIIVMIVLYAVSGTTVVKPDEVAVILRWGRLVGDIPARQQHGPGLLITWPRPIDRVVRVPVKRVWAVPVRDLASIVVTDDPTLDPLTQGYALTGDRNVVHVDMVARYRVRDPAEWAFYGPPSETILRTQVTAAVVRSIGEMGVDHVLADGRNDLTARAARRTQAGLDAVHAGLELTSLELTRLMPPVALARHFDAVQSAYIGAETKRKEALAFAGAAVPQARAEADRGTQAARGAAETSRATAEGEAAAFIALDREYRANPPVVRERLYRDAIERAIVAADHVQWIPPPAGGKYTGFRVTVRSGTARMSAVDEDR